MKGFTILIFEPIEIVLIVKLDSELDCSCVGHAKQVKDCECVIENVIWCLRQ